MYRLYIFLISFCFVLSACAHHEVRHLSSDACLVVPGQTTQQEVLGLMGFPDKKVIDPTRGEIWYYVENNKSMMRSTPYIGKKLGSEDYDLLSIIFEKDIVHTCTYRNFDEKEFGDLGLIEGAEEE